MKINLLRLLVFASIITPGVLSSQKNTPITVDNTNITVFDSDANALTTEKPENVATEKYFRKYHVSSWHAEGSKQKKAQERKSQSRDKRFSRSTFSLDALSGTHYSTLFKCYASITPYGPTTFCQGGSVVLHASSGTSWLWSTGEITQNITVNQSGTYTVTIFTGTCSATAQRTVTVNPNPVVTITPDGPTTFCQGDSVVLTATGGSSYIWSTGATTQSITVYTSGNFSVMVTNASGCTSTCNAIQVTVIPNPQATITPYGPTTFCQGGSVVLHASNGSAWLWSTGATTQNITVNTSGTYSVTVYTAQCPSTASITVTVNPNPTATITPGGPTTFCQGGSVTLTASAGASWLWSTGATTQSITVNTSGSYSVMVTNASGCTSSCNAVQVTVLPNPQATITPNGPTTFCQGGSVVLHASNGTSWLWSTGATTQNITATASGTYTVTVSNAQCTSTASITVTVNPNPVATITPSGPTTFCQGGSVTLTASAGASWLWSTGATTQSITVTTSGSYSVMVTNASGCTSSSNAVQVTVIPNPAVTITPNGPTTFCQGGSVVLSASAGASYIWSTGAITQNITATTSGTYSVIVTNTNGCTGSASINVTVNPNPTATITPSGPTTFCQGGSVTLTASAGSSWLWSTGATTQSITVNTSGSYSVMVTNANGCTSSCNAVQVTVLPNPQATITPNGPTTFCQGGSVILHASNGTAWLWSTGATTQNITATTSGTYSVTVSNGQCTSTATITVTVNPNPVATITPNGPTTFCQGGSVQLTSSAGSSYLWSTGAITQSITVNATGSYSVTVTNANGCSASASINVTVIPNPVVTITPNGPTTFCQGGSVILTSSAGASYLWSTGAITQSITATTSGTYSVVVINSNGCTGSASINVTVNPNPTATITPSGPTTFCQGGSVTLTASAGSSWIWSTGATTQSITVTTSGSYSVMVTNANGCTSSCSAVQVTVLPNPAVTITPNGPTTFCQGGSVILTSSAGASYLWSTGAITQSITATTSGTYSVVVINSNGCTGSASINVTVNPNPTATITPSGPTTFCQGGSVTLTASAGSSWIWSTGATTQSITVNTSGSYSVMVTNANGCTSSCSAVQVTVLPNPAVTITPNGPTTFCQGGSVVLSASAGAFYLWSNGAVTQNITVNTAGTYSVIVTNASGCTGSASINVTVNPNPIATVTPGGPTTFCQGGSVVLTASAGTSWLWSTGATTQSITVNASGNYSVTVTNANGCSATSIAIPVIVLPNPQATITPNGPTTFCQGGSVVLHASSGTVWLWSTGAITQDITVNASGTYSVTINNGLCTSTASITITVTPAPVVTITPDGPTTFCQGDSVILTASNGVSWIWSTGATTQSITALTSGNYSVTVTNAGGCTGSASINVTVNPNPVATITPDGPTTFCQGDSVILTASAGTSYLWSTNATTQSITVLTSGLYSVMVTNASGCTSACNAVQVTVLPNPQASITPNGPTSFCDGGSVVLHASNGTTWVWSTGATTQNITVNTTGTYSVIVSNGQCVSTAAISVTEYAPVVAVITPDGPTIFCQGDSVILTANNGASYLWSSGETTQSITAHVSGTYSVMITDSNGCSSPYSAITVTVLPAPQAVISGPAAFCNGDSVTLHASSGTVWLWSTGAVTQDIVVNASGTYSVTIGNGICTSTASFTVTEHAPVAVSVTPNGPTTFCQGDSVTLTANSSSSYLWNTGAITQSIVVNSTGTYSVMVTDSNGCSASSAGISVTELPVAVASITPGGPTSFCQGDSVTLTANSGTSYLWSTGAVSQSIVASSSGNYSVTVGNGQCSDTASVNVTEHPASTAAVTANGPTTFCQGDSVMLTANAGLSYLWSNGATSQSIVVDSTGTYSVMVTDSNGCSASSAGVLVTALPAPVATITPNGPTSFCQGDSVTLTANQGSAYAWSTGANTQSITVYSTGTYSVTVGNSSCSSSASIGVNEFPATTVTVTANGPVTFCAGDSVTLTANSNSAYLWSTGDTTQNITVYTSGNYSVNGTDTNGCSAHSNVIAVTVNPAATASITPNGPTTFCQGDSVTLSANSGNAYLWSTGATTQNITVYTSGTYSVTVGNGTCADSASISINVTPVTPATISASGPLTFCQGDSVLLTANSGSSYQWSDGSTTQSIVVSNSGNYSVIVGSGACAATATVNVLVLPAMQAAIFPCGPIQLCQGDSIVLTSTYGNSWLWSTGETTQSITVYNAGNYYVTITSQCGNSTSPVVNVMVSPSAATAGFTYTSDLNVYTFTNTSTGATGYQWNFGDSTGSDEVNPVHAYDQPGTYTVTLIANSGCGSDTTTDLIVIEDKTELTGFFNGFSPNGDGINDGWNIPMLENYPVNNVTVINRWGNEVWKADNYNNTSVMWTGRNLNSEELPDGTYYFIITYNDQQKRGWVFIKR